MLRFLSWASFHRIAGIRQTDSRTRLCEGSDDEQTWMVARHGPDMDVIGSSQSPVAWYHTAYPKW